MKELINVEFPVKYYEGNVLFCNDGTSWAYFKLNGYEYDFLSFQEKVRISRDFEAFFAAQNYDTHYLILPQFHSIEDIHEEYKTTITGELKEQAINHLDEAIEPINQNIGAEASDYFYYIGVKLPHSDYESDDIKGMVEQWKDLKNQIFSLVDLEKPDITKTEYDRAINKAKGIEGNLQQNIKSVSAIQPVDEMDIQWLIKRNFYRSICKTPINKTFKPKAETTEKGKHVFTPEVLRLTEGIVDNKSKFGQLSITQLVNGIKKTGYTAFLTVSYAPEEIAEIGEEWLYLNQTFNFPVETSIRVHPHNHRKMKGKIKNKKKEIQSDWEHAEDAENEAPMEVQENSGLVRDLEKFVKTTRMPILETSIVFSVSAETQEELQNRIQTIIDEYNDLNIEVQQPGSDQWLLFNEFLPGAKRYLNDYLLMIDPLSLAAGMFGATTNIGDGQGFYAGMELSKRSPVFINPSLAAKDVVATKTKSLSAAFVGPPGGGKSFAANLIIYLSVLSGGRALIIDPKGERTNWPEDLHFIKGHVNVVELTAENENKGRLDPFMISDSVEDAHGLAVNILSFLTQYSFKDDEFMAITDAVEEVSAMDQPCMDKVVEYLLNSQDEMFQRVGRRVRAFQKLSFAKLLFGDGETYKPLDYNKYEINIIQIQNLKLPPKEKKIDSYDFQEMLSMALMFPIGQFARNFMHGLPSNIFKIVHFEESWFIEKTDIGIDIINRLQREGRALNAGIYRSTQAVNDTDEESKSMMGMKFIFQNNNVSECQNALNFLGLDENDESNIRTIQNLQTGQCLFQDIRGRTAVIQIQHLFKDLEKAFDTRPKAATQEKEIEEEKQELIHV